MSDTLAKICADKLELVRVREKARPFAVVDAAAREASRPRGFLNALRTHVNTRGSGLIAEVKKGSPSKGLIRGEFDPPALARAYQAGGATCLSVLTDTPHFLGRDEDLIAARGAVALPCLRKDFMLESYQIAESRALGADCILLILAALSDAQAAELEAAAHGYGMDVLAEVHDAAEMERALRLKTRLIGINNRNLKTLKVDLATTENLARMVPEDRLLVAESGLASAADLQRMRMVGARIFLIGESLMRQEDVTEATRSLLAGRDWQKAA